MKHALAILLLAVAVPVYADDGHPGKLDAAAVTELVGKLASEDVDIRDEASAELRKAGKAVLDDLKRELSGNVARNADVRDRLERLIARIVNEAAVKSAADWCAEETCPRCGKKSVWKAEQLMGRELSRLCPKTTFFWLQWTCCPATKYSTVPSELLAVSVEPDGIVELKDFTKFTKLAPWLAPAVTEEAVKERGATIIGLVRCIGTERKPVFVPAPGKFEAMPSGERSFDGGGIAVGFDGEGHIVRLWFYAE